MVKKPETWVCRYCGLSIRVGPRNNYHPEGWMKGMEILDKHLPTLCPECKYTRKTQTGKKIPSL